MSAIGKYFQYTLSGNGVTLPLSTNSYDSLVKGEAPNVVDLLKNDIIQIKSQLPYDKRLGQDVLLIVTLLRTHQQIVIPETSLDICWTEIPSPEQPVTPVVSGQPNRELLNKRLLPTTPQGWAIQKLYVMLSAYISTLDQQYVDGSSFATCEIYGQAVLVAFGVDDDKENEVQTTSITLSPVLDTDGSLKWYIITETQGEALHAALRANFSVSTEKLLGILEGFYQNDFAGWVKYNES